MTTFRFDDFEYDSAAAELRRRGEPVALQPLAGRLLQALLEAPDTVLAREALLLQLWPDTVVVQNALDQLVRRLRDALGETARQPRFIHTVPRIGYRFVGTVAAVEPVTSPGFFGRPELARVAAGLRTAGLWVLVGPGGAGKTRLVLEALSTHDGEAVFVELAPVQSRLEVLGAVGRALGLQLGTDDPASQVGSALAARAGVAVVLDNVEHVQAVVREILVQWRAQAPGVAWSVTSRVPLGLPGEEVLRLGGLAPSAARALFLDRMQRVGGTFGSEHLPHVDTILTAVDHLPLGIELVAARTRTFSLSDLVARLSQLPALAARRDGTGRHDGLERTVAWSWELLSPPRRDALAQLAVFRGAFDLDAAVAVLGVPDGEALDHVEALHDASLLEIRTDSERRYRLFEMVKRFAGRQGLEPATRDRHASWFARLDATAGTRGAIDELTWGATAPSPGPAVACALAASEVLLSRGPYASAEVVLRSVLARGDLDPVSEGRLLGALGDTLRRGRGADEALTVLDRALALLEAAGETAAAGRVASTRGEALRGQGRIDEALMALEHAAQLGAAAGDDQVVASAHASRAMLHLDTGDMATAEQHARQGLTLASLCGDTRLRGWVLNTLGILALRQGRQAEALPLYEASLQARRAVGDLAAVATQLGNLANVHLDEGRVAEARALYTEARDIYARMGHRRGLALATLGLGVIHGNEGDAPGAQALYREAAAHAHATRYTAIEALCFGNLGESLAEEGRAAEAVVALDHAVAVSRSLGHKWRLAVTLRQAAGAQLQLGQLDGAGALLDEALPLLTDVGDDYELARCACVRAELAAGRAQVERAHRLLDEATELARRARTAPLELLDEVRRIRTRLPAR